MRQGRADGDEMKIAVVEDVAADRELLCSHLHTYFGQDRFSGEIHLEVFESGEAFLNDSPEPSPELSLYRSPEPSQKYPSGNSPKPLPDKRYDLVFLDCYMREISGMEVAQRIRSQDEHTVIIFTTYSSDFAVEGYKIKAAGYLLKPITYQDFTDILDIIDLGQIRARDYILLENGHESIKIFLRDIIYCDISKHYSQVHTQSMGMLRFRMPFAALSDQLNASREFYLCYRGCIVNLAQVKKIDQLVLHMSNGDRVPFRKREYHKLLRLHREFLFEKARGQL